MNHRRPPRRLSALLIVAGLFAFTGMAAPATAETPVAEVEIRALAEGLRNGTVPTSLASEQCRQGIAEGEDAGEVALAMSAYLEVPEELALSALCEALVRAIRAGEVTVDGLVVVAREQRDADGFLELGRILRAVYFSHRLTTTASAGGQAPQ